MSAFEYDGRSIPAGDQHSIAAALVAAGEPPELFCGIGVCFACLVTVNGRPGQRACLTVAQPGDVVRSGDTVDAQR